MKRPGKGVIEAADLAFAYAETPVLSLPHLVVPEASHTLIYGDSGCGKSTFLNLIAGVLSGYSGKLRVLGADLASMSPAKRDTFRAHNIAVIFQQFNLIPYLSAMDNVRLALRVARAPFDENRIAGLFGHLQLAHVAKQRAGELSHGQQQRVAAARALAVNARLILADEPTSALDDTNARLFLDLLFREAEQNGRTIVVVSHDLRYKRRFSQTIDLAALNRAAAKTGPARRKK